MVSVHRTPSCSNFHENHNYCTLTDTLNEKLVTLRQSIVRHHQVMFSPPVPQVEVTELPQLGASKQGNNNIVL